MQEDLTSQYIYTYKIHIHTYKNFKTRGGEVLLIQNFEVSRKERMWPNISFFE